MTLFLQILVMICSAVADIWLFCLLAQIRPSKLDWSLLLALEAVLSVALSNFQTYSSLIYETALESLLFCGYFYFANCKNKLNTYHNIWQILTIYAGKCGQVRCQSTLLESCSLR
ncbi:hypothetical protein LOB45_10165, partial [Lactobacillus delbrueckii subsp. lactis]|nr:hypothetical protein [Lactobacillus delbrueckii subsp. lactis]